MAQVALDADLLVEHLVDTLADYEPSGSNDLAKRLNLPVLMIRNELVKLERHGIVYRTGQTRGTLWWLG